MARTPSPLRYPGGKASILNMTSKILFANDLKAGHYAEPYAGGAGLALSLMFKGVVHELHLNDLDRSIWSFWYVLLNETERFIEEVTETPVTMDVWYKQRYVQENKDEFTDFELAFSSFFLNRTNRSGIILKAGVIGGKEQLGKYKLNCRFNKDDLIERIRRISKYAHRIHLYNIDAIDFLKETNKSLPTSSFYCIDPPYYVKGGTLYTNSYEAKDHKKVRDAIDELDHPWMLTYDNVEAIQYLYAHRQRFKFNLNYSAATKRVGTELLVTSDNLIVPHELGLCPL